MKINTTYDVYCYRYSNGKYQYSEVATSYDLIDNDININLGDLSFKEYRKKWLRGDENRGIIYNIYYHLLDFDNYYEKNKINQLKEEINNNIDDVLENTLEDINNTTIELKDYINNDLDKIKSLLLLVVDEFTSKHASELYGNKITQTIYDEEYDWIY